MKKSSFMKGLKKLKRKGLSHKKAYGKMLSKSKNRSNKGKNKFRKQGYWEPKEAGNVVKDIRRQGDKAFLGEYKTIKGKRYRAVYSVD